MKRVRLDAIAFDAGTQVRAALDTDHVIALAEAMTSGAVIPPIVLFHDGSAHYIGDGFHRFMAAQRLQWREIDAEVRAGTKDDALWFALGANRTNGKNMTPADKRHAILLALKTWPERSARQIAEQIGCTFKYVALVKDEVCSTTHLPSRVTGKDGKSYPASRPSAKPEPAAKNKSREAVQQRREQMRELAEVGHTSRQIAAAVGMTEEGCRSVLREHAIDVPADRVVGKTKRHDSTRILEQIVFDAETLTADVGLIDFDELDPARFAGWLQGLSRARKDLDGFIRRLTKEQEKHEAA